MASCDGGGGGGRLIHGVLMWQLVPILRAACSAQVLHDRVPITGCPQSYFAFVAFNAFFKLTHTHTHKCKYNIDTFLVILLYMYVCVRLPIVYKMKFIKFAFLLLAGWFVVVRGTQTCHPF